MDLLSKAGQLVPTHGFPFKILMIDYIIKLPLGCSGENTFLANETGNILFSYFLC
jgi:hypothetical protein